jgi:hypothetical protein
MTKLDKVAPAVALPPFQNKNASGQIAGGILFKELR